MSSHYWFLAFVNRRQAEIFAKRIALGGFDWPFQLENPAVIYGCCHGGILLWPVAGFLKARSAAGNAEQKALFKRKSNISRLNCIT